MLDVVLAGVSGLVLAVLLTQPPKRPSAPTNDEAAAAEAPVSLAAHAGAKADRAKRTPNKWN